MIDTHSHLLPRLDDGASSPEETIAMVSEASRSGIREIVCTPHLRESHDPAASCAIEVLEETRRTLTDRGIALQLHLGYELGFSFVTSLTSVDPTELERFVVGERSKAILVEVPHSGWPLFAEETIYRLRLHGYLPILAHPERNDRIQERPELLTELLRLGAIAQGTVASLEGVFGPRSRRCLLQQISAGHISLLGTDAHFSRRSSWSFAGSVRRLQRNFSSETMLDLVQRNPRLVLEGETPRPPQPQNQRRSLRSYLSRSRQGAGYE